MIEKMNKWLSAHKQLCVITGIFGLLVSPFLWPVFLAVIIQSLPTNEGLDVELTGDWKPTKYGMQYSVSNFSVTMPTTKEGIRTYLSSSLIKGIGPAMAARIVETFGEDTLNVFNDSPEKLLQVKGITQKRLDDILEG